MLVIEPGRPSHRKHDGIFYRHTGLEHAVVFRETVALYRVKLAGVGSSVAVDEGFNVHPDCVDDQSITFIMAD